MAKKDDKAPKARGTRLLGCTCPSEYQDAKYGRGLRVHNIGGSKDRMTFSCTVCGVKR